MRRKNAKCFFQPIVASSLVLALGISIGEAQNIGNQDPQYNMWYKPTYVVMNSNMYAAAYTNGLFDPWDNSASDKIIWTHHDRIQGSGINNGGFQLRAKASTVEVQGMIDIQGGRATVNFDDAYLRFTDHATGSSEHFFRALDGKASVSLTFNGGRGSETIGSTTWNNLAFYGALLMQTNNDNQDTITLSNGASWMGLIKAGASGGRTNVDITLTGGGNIVAIQKDHYINGSNNIKGKALELSITKGTTGTPNSSMNIAFGESGKQEYVNDSTLLDDDGVIVGKITNGSVESSSTVQSGKTLITNAIKGDIYVAGYNATQKQYANFTTNFYNNGLIEGNIQTSSLANIKIYFANKGIIRGDLNFAMGGDGSAGALVIAKSAGDQDANKRVDDLTIEGNINNQGLDNYTLTAKKFLMRGSAITGGGKKLTFDTHDGIFENFSLNNNGSTEISATNSLAISSSEDLATAGTLIITNNATQIMARDLSSNSIDVKGIYGIGDYRSSSNSSITTKGNLNAGILAAVKSDGNGDGSIQTTLNIDNSNNSGNVVLSVIGKDATGSDLKLRGGKISDTTLANSGGKLTDRGNIVMFNNMQNGKTEATFTAGTNSTINVVGDIYVNNGNNNLKLVDISKTTMSDIPEFIGNITVNNGKTNLVFDGTVWAPSNIVDLLPNSFSASSDAKSALLTYVKTYGTGKVFTTNGGVANIVLRQGSGSDFGTQQAIFSVETKGSSYTNILMQKNGNAHFNIAAAIDYDENATTRVIFAGSNNLLSTTESFATSNDFSNVGVNGVQMLGVTYKDGVMFEVGAKTQAQRELIQRYRGVYGNGALLTLGTNIDNNQGIGLTISGLFMGDAVALAPSNPGSKAATTYNINIQTNAVVAGNMKNQTSDQLNVIMKAGSKIFLDPTISGGFGTTNEFVTLDFQNATHDYSQDLVDSIRTTNTVVDLGTMGVDYASLATKTMEAYNLLKIKELSGDKASFRVRVGNQNGVAKNVGANGSGITGYSDRVIVEATKNTQILREYLQPVYTDNVNVDSIKYSEGGNNNIAVLTTKNGTDGKALVNLGALDAIEGFDQISSGLKAVVTDQSGSINSGGGYTTYFLAQAESKGASEASQESSISALSLNYDLYIANLNSLNKRMGELRYNPYSQGVWARVFNGQQTTKFGLQTKSNYTTVQVGYDYDFGFEGANNYAGIALSYAASNTTSSTMTDINAVIKGINSAKSQAVEVALYNAYVQDGASVENGFKNGLYSDSILKFSYIMSDVTLLGQTGTYSTNNYGLTLSEEVGYRFLLGENNEWFIDPQAEITFGYLNQTNLKQTLESGAYLDGVQNSIITLRGRVGSSFGYKFDRFTQDKDFRAQVYIGAYFVGDYIAGGDVSLTTTRGIKTSLAPMASTSRGLIDFGTNFDIKDQHKIYFDFEKSFGGTIITDYQINIGYRFAFGENTGYTPINTVNKEVAPLKVDSEIKEGSAGQEADMQEQIQAVEKNTSSSESKNEEKAQ